MPPKNKTETIIDAQPGSELCITYFPQRAYINAIKATPETAKPIQLASRSGASEKDVIPSRAKRNIFPYVYPVFPPCLSDRSYSTKVCLKPIQEICPRRNLFCSGIAFNTSTTFLSIILKSPVSKGISTDAIRAKSL